MFLYLDTSSDQGLIALSAGAEILEEVSFQAGKKGGGDLLPLIKSIMDAHQVKIADLKAIVVGIGPGSFTGTRVAVSVAQGFSLPSKVPLIPLSSLLFFKPGLHAEYLAVHDARRGDVYALCARLSLGGDYEYGNAYVSSVKDLALDEALPKLWVSPSHESIEEELPKEVSIDLMSVKPSVAHLLDYVQDLYDKKTFISAPPLPLEYLRGVVLPKTNAST